MKFRQALFVLACSGMVAAAGVVGAPMAAADLPVPGLIGYTPVDGVWVQVPPDAVGSVSALAEGTACEPGAWFSPGTPVFYNVQGVTSDRLNLDGRVVSYDEAVTGTAGIRALSSTDACSARVLAAERITDLAPVALTFQQTEWTYTYGSYSASPTSGQHVQRNLNGDPSSAGVTFSEVGLWYSRWLNVGGVMRYVYYAGGCHQNVHAYQIVEGGEVIRVELLAQQECDQPPLPPADTAAMLS